MNDFEIKFKKFLELPFPDLNRKEILGIDLVQLNNDSTKLISKFFLLKGHLNRQDFELIQSCSHKLKKVYREFDGLARKYFAMLLNIVSRIIDSFNRTNRIVDEREEKLLEGWRNYYQKIKYILNMWDPLGVADIAEDEYDSMNYLTYSALTKTGKLNDIKEALRDYSENSMHIYAGNDVFTKVAAEILKIKE